jgi:CRISPR-associated endonuclease/helicase Cas3
LTISGFGAGLSFAADLWAKSPLRTSGAGQDGYPLLPHLLDVSAVASVLLRTVPCPVVLPCSEAWLVALVGLHDLGKASPQFQRKLGRSHICGYRLEKDQPDRHDIGTAVLLRDGLRELGHPNGVATALSHAVAAHHGNPFTANEILNWAWDPSPQWSRAHRELIEAVIAATSASGAPALPDHPIDQSAFLQWLMGLTTAADWIGSSEALCRWERVQQWQGQPHCWFEQSQQLAADVVTQVGLASEPLPALPNGQIAMDLVLAGIGCSPRPLQKAVASLLDELPKEPALIVIEAPMGEGKTEAALCCSFGSRGLYLAMPTQATSNALFQRVAEFLRNIPGPGEGYHLALAHGAGGPEAAALKLRDIGLDTGDSRVRAGWWFQGGKRSLLCPQGIGTVDQGLIGVLQSRHGFLRLYGLTGRTVIFDEVHAYDTYTGGLIERLISWLQALGCRVVVMSATLPETRRQALLKSWASVDEVELPTEDSYPRISWALPGMVQATTFSAGREQQIEVRGMLPDAAEIASQASAWAHEGVRVLVVVNKVARAQRIFRLLRTSTRATLFHARFPMEQRLEIEAGVLTQFGPAGSCAGGHVLVATQVAEQSLDIDFDVLITDPAPVDLVLQRLGRIHRHPRARAEGFGKPMIYLADLESLLPSEDLTSFVYDRWDVLRSVAWLRENRQMSLPEDIDRAVQEVYGSWQPAGPEALLAELTHACKAHQVSQGRMRTQANQVAIGLPEDWSLSQDQSHRVGDDAAETDALRFGTRLGGDSETVIPVTPEDLADLECRAHVLRQRYLRIGHPQLIQAARSAPTPDGWNAQAGLAPYRPLLLDQERRVQSVPVNARLDPVLGLVVGVIE